MKKFWLLSVFAFAALAGTAVWFGGLNQDEGWYLYASRMVAEGMMPYRDFAYTQGPLMPVVYSAFNRVWDFWGILGARILTLLMGAVSLVFAVGLTRKVCPPSCREFAPVAVFMLLGCNLYHLYYIAIPKTYALAGMFLMIGFYLLALAEDRRRFMAPAAAALAFAAGTRISLGAVLAVVGVSLLSRRRWSDAFAFAAGGLVALAVVYGPFLLDDAARQGLVDAQRYHAARGGGDIVWTVGSLSRLVRWYLPVFILFGMGFTVKTSSFVRVVGLSFAAVFAVQMLAPFPYEDYQVPIMPLLAVFSTVKFASSCRSVPLSASRPALLVLGLSFACAFSNPLLEKWTTNAQDRFWTRKKERSELAQLREVAARIEALDPGGKELLTQDLYLAVETSRRVPRGLEMGPFAVLDDVQWRNLLENTTCPVAALSGYTFAVEPPRCDERPVEKQLEYWNILKKRYRLVAREEDFGQNATTLLLLERSKTE